MQNLFISRIELRQEEDPDIQAFTHARKIEKVVVALEGDLLAVKEKLQEVQVRPEGATS